MINDINSVPPESSSLDRALEIRDFFFNEAECYCSVKTAAELILSPKLISFSEIESMWADHIRICGDKDTHSLYIHMPFCVSRCSFCSCYSRVGSDCEIKEYSKNLIGHLKKIKDVFKGFSFDNLYIGGGTPTIMDEKTFKEFIDTIFSSFSFTGKGQICSEMDPFTYSPEKLALLKAHGFTRVSIGVQSFNPEVLKLNNRGHQTEKMVRQAVSDAKKAGFKYINVDLLVGLYGDTSDSLVDSFKKAIDTGAQKISLYALQPVGSYLDERFDGKSEKFDSFWKSIIEGAIEDISLVAERAGYSVPYYSEWYMKMLNCDSWAYSDTRVENTEKNYSFEAFNQSLLGIGENASSKILDAIVYKTGVPFLDDPEKCSYIGRRMNKRDQKIFFIVNNFSRKMRLDFEEFTENFGTNILDEFPLAIQRLKSLNAIACDDKGLSLLTEDKTERSVHILMFFNDKEVEEAIESHCPGGLDAVIIKKEKKEEKEYNTKEDKEEKMDKLKELDFENPEKKAAWTAFRDKGELVTAGKEKEILHGFIKEKKDADSLIFTDADGKDFQVSIPNGCVFGRNYVKDGESAIEEEVSLDDLLDSKNTFVIFCLKDSGNSVLLIKEIINI